MPEGPVFPNLFSPIRIGGVAIKNRILSSGHDTVMAADGKVTDQLIAYHEARAAGGAGLIVIQVGGVHESARYTYHVLMVTDDDCIPGYSRLAETIHRHDCKVFGQLFHPGREIMESQDGSFPVAYAPSVVPNERFHVMPREIDDEMIRDIIDGYGAGAARLKEAGLDGVEIVASHGYLPAQFMSPRLNLRTDSWGGDEKRRLRFVRHVIGSIRSAVGRRDFVVGLRISGGELSDNGLTVEEAVEVCRALDGDGQLDYFSVVVGTSDTYSGSNHIVPPAPQPAGYTAPAAAAIKAAVNVPVMVAGRINQPQEAEQILASGQADMTAMTRALICDPLMPAKAADGRAEDIRACIGCNQACIGHFHAGYPISCIQRPETGREQRYGDLEPASVPRDVMVVGGGPGGMKAAVIAAQRGHHVTLFEAGRRLGGQVLLAQELPGRSEFGGAVTNLQSELERYGVEVITGTRVDSALVESRGPDAVVVATGARPRHPDLELNGDPVVLDAWQVIGGEQVPSGHVVVADWRCDWVGLGVATRLAQQGHRVTLAVDGYMAGFLLQQYVRNTMLADAHRAGVTVIPTVRLFGADPDTVYLQHALSGEPVVIEDVAATVLAQGHVPVDFTRELHGWEGEVHAIGDCVSPRTVEEAVLEGLQVGAAL